MGAKREKEKNEFAENAVVLIQPISFIMRLQSLVNEGISWMDKGTCAETVRRFTLLSDETSDY